MTENDPEEFQTLAVCNEKHKRVDEKMDCYEADIRDIKKLIKANADSVNKKVLATAFFFIIILVTLVIDLIEGGF